MIQITQSLEDFTAAGSEPAFSRTRVRKYLGRHGLHGTALTAEVDRITRGYAASLFMATGGQPTGGEWPDPLLSAAHYPYGWPKPAMTRLMKRMFHGHQRRAHPILVVDEFWQLAKPLPPLPRGMR